MGYFYVYIIKCIVLHKNIYYIANYKSIFSIVDVIHRKMIQLYYFCSNAIQSKYKKEHLGCLTKTNNLINVFPSDIYYSSWSFIIMKRGRIGKHFYTVKQEISYLKLSIQSSFVLIFTYQGLSR